MKLDLNDKNMTKVELLDTLRKMLIDTNRHYGKNSHLLVDEIEIDNDHLVIPTKYFLKSRFFVLPHRLEFRLYYDSDMLLLKLVDTGVLYDTLAYNNSKYELLSEMVQSFNRGIDLDHDNGYLYFCLPLSDISELDTYYNDLMLECFKYVIAELNKDSKIISA